MTSPGKERASPQRLMVDTPLPAGRRVTRNLSLELTPETTPLYETETVPVTTAPLPTAFPDTRSVAPHNSTPMPSVMNPTLFPIVSQIATPLNAGVTSILQGQGGQQTITTQDLALHMLRMEQHILLLQTQMENQRQAMLLASAPNNPPTSLPPPVTNTIPPPEPNPANAGNHEIEQRPPSATTSSHWRHPTPRPPSCTWVRERPLEVPARPEPAQHSAGASSSRALTNREREKRKQPMDEQTCDERAPIKQYTERENVFDNRRPQSAAHSYQ